MNVKRFLAHAGLVAAASFAAAAAVPGTALADSADTPVGHLTAEKVTCGDFGERVKVTVTGAIPDAQYEAHSTRGSLPWSEPFTKDSSGVLTTQVHNVRPDVEPYIGLATITVTASTGQSGQVTVWDDCPSLKGD